MNINFQVPSFVTKFPAQAAAHPYQVAGGVVAVGVLGAAARLVYVKREEIAEAASFVLHKAAVFALGFFAGLFLCAIVISRELTHFTFFPLFAKFEVNYPALRLTLLAGGIVGGCVCLYNSK